MSYITTIKKQLCYPCNKNLSFIKLKQALNCKVHNLGNAACRFLFLAGSYMQEFTVITPYGLATRFMSSDLCHY